MGLPFLSRTVDRPANRGIVVMGLLKAIALLVGQMNPILPWQHIWGETTARTENLYPRQSTR